MRIKIIQKPHELSIDGLRLDGFEVGQRYEVGSSLGALLLAEQWAEPLPLEERTNLIAAVDREPPVPAQVAAGLPRPDPSNLVREVYPPCVDRLPALAAEFDRRKRKR